MLAVLPRSAVVAEVVALVALKLSVKSVLVEIGGVPGWRRRHRYVPVASGDRVIDMMLPASIYNLISKISESQRILVLVLVLVVSRWS